MTNAYRWVQWNRHKRVYDLTLAGVLLAYVLGFVGIGLTTAGDGDPVSPPILVMRALGTAAAVLLHVILAIGPLSRLTTKVAPLLYNRRHMGVTCFFVALLHAAIAIGFYGGFGSQNPILAVLAGPGVRPPFELYGFGALLILFVMAATSHDFWLANLGPRVWKWLHMLVYVAYALLVAHIAFGAIASERSPIYPILLGLGVVGLTGLHVVVGFRESRRESQARPAEGWIDLGACADIPEARARIVCIHGAERVAVFRDGDRLHAMSNVCAHQGGPLGEGKIVDGCVTCPWHGYQYRPGDGCSPPPYTEKIPTYELRVEGGRVMLNPEPRAPGTPVEPVSIPNTSGEYPDA